MTLHPNEVQKGNTIESGGKHVKIVDKITAN